MSLEGCTLEELRALVRYFKSQAQASGIGLPVGGPLDSETEDSFRTRVIKWLQRVEPDVSKRRLALRSIRLIF